MLKQKKAVSPLIATVLLIAFAVALGAVVMNWGRGYVEETASFAKEKSDTEIECSMNVKLSFVSIGGTDQVCYNDTTLEFTLEAGPRKDVEGIQVRTISDSGMNISSVANSSIQKGYARKFTLGYANSTFGSIRQVRIAPEIAVAGQTENTLCPGSAVVKENISIC